MDGQRPVAMLNYIHDTAMVLIIRHAAEAESGVEQISKPLRIHQYNYYMNDVDRHDQLTAYYGFTHGNKKWWKGAFFHLFEVAIVNAYILYVAHSKQTNH